MSTAKIRMAMACLVLLYTLALMWNFRYIIGEYYDYIGFLFSIKSAAQIALTLAITLLPVWWLPLTPARPSVFLYLILYLVVYVPACVVPAFTEGVSDLSLTRLQLLLIASFAIIGLAFRVRTIDLPSLRLSKFDFWALFAFASGGTLLWVAMAFGLNLQFHSFADIYNIRESHSDIAEDHHRLLIYLLAWQANVFGPLLLAYAWSRRSFVLGGGALLVQLWLYSISGYKSFLLAIPLVIMAIVFSRCRQRGSMMLLLASALLLLVATCSLLDYLSDGASYSTVFVRRLLLTPGRQTFWYYDFFSINPKAMLAHSVLGSFIQYPYEASPPALIGQTHFGTYEANANGNLWADAYANFGGAGMLCFSALLAAFMWVYDSAARRIDYRLATALIAMPAISLCNSALLTSLLSHGLGISLAVILFYPTRKERKASTSNLASRYPATRQRTATVNGQQTPRPALTGQASIPARRSA